MTLQELIIDLKAAGANDNTVKLAMNCYQIGRMEVVYAHTNETVQMAIAIEREACISDIRMHIPRSGRDTLEYKMAMRMIERIRARGTA
jgi:hypothetical protein